MNIFLNTLDFFLPGEPVSASAGASRAAALAEGEPGGEVCGMMGRRCEVEGEASPGAGSAGVWTRASGDAGSDAPSFLIGVAAEMDSWLPATSVSS